MKHQPSDTKLLLQVLSDCHHQLQWTILSLEGLLQRSGEGFAGWDMGTIHISRNLPREMLNSSCMVLSHRRQSLHFPHHSSCLLSTGTLTRTVTAQEIYKPITLKAKQNSGCEHFCEPKPDIPPKSLWFQTAAYHTDTDLSTKYTPRVP